MGIAAWREFHDSFRVGDDVRSLLGLKFLGYVSAFHGPADTVSPRGTAIGLEQPPAPFNITRLAIENPSSIFAETLRNAKIAADVVLHGQKGKVLGVISVLPHEGKSTIAANFASLLAVMGGKTLLIDADLRNPGLTRSLSLTPNRGLVQAVLETSRGKIGSRLTEPNSPLFQRFLTNIFSTQASYYLARRCAGFLKKPARCMTTSLWIFRH